MTTTKYILAFLIFLSLISCSNKTKSTDPMIETFIKLIDKTNQMNISFVSGKDSARQFIDTAITKVSEVDRLKEYIQQSVKSDSCNYRLDGTIAFRNNSGASFTIGFGLHPICPIFYFYIEGKPVTFKMPEESEAYLTGIKNSLFSRSPTLGGKEGEGVK